MIGQVNPLGNKNKVMTGISQPGNNKIGNKTICYDVPSAIQRAKRNWDLK